MTKYLQWIMRLLTLALDIYSSGSQPSYFFFFSVTRFALSLRLANADVSWDRIFTVCSCRYFSGYLWLRCLFLSGSPKRNLAHPWDTVTFHFVRFNCYENKTDVLRIFEHYHIEFYHQFRKKVIRTHTIIIEWKKNH